MVSLIDDWERLGEYRELRGNRIFVVDRAAGGAEAAEPVLVLHGFPTCSFDWRAPAASLARRRRVIMLDFLGFGLSAKPDRRYSLFEQADIVEALAAALGLDTVTLVSHDMGDSVAGELLARSIEGGLDFSITGRVLTNGSIYLDMAHLTDGQQMLLAMPDEMVPEESAFPPELLSAALRATLAADANVPEPELRALAELIVREDGNRLLPRTIRYIEERRQHEGRWTGAIERHPSPLTIIWGDADPIAVWPMAERLHAARPDATLVRLEGIGHYPMIEAPDAFGAALEHALDH